MESPLFYNECRLSAAPLVVTQVSLRLCLGVAALQGIVEVSLHLGVPFFLRTQDWLGPAWRFIEKKPSRTRNPSRKRTLSVCQKTLAGIVEDHRVGGKFGQVEYLH